MQSLLPGTLRRIVRIVIQSRHGTAAITGQHGNALAAREAEWEAMKRKDILDTAKGYVTKDRASDHGDMENNFRTIAMYWSVHLGVPVSATDVSVMMTMLKVARIKSNPKHVDNWVDGAGYLACGGELETE